MRYLLFLLFFCDNINVDAQCVTTNLYLTTCGSFAQQTFTNQAGANNGTAPPATCNFGTGSTATSTWVHFTYVGPPTQQYLEGGQAPGGAGNNPALAVYTNNGCTLLGCSATNTNPGPTEAAADGKIDLTTLGLTIGQEYLVRIYNEGNTSNQKDKTLRCIPSAPCGDCFTNPCVISNINTSFSSSTFGSHNADCCTFPVNNLGAVSQLDCPGPGQVAVDGNIWYQFTVCQNGLVTATLTSTSCSNTSGSQIWFLQGNCNGGSATFNNLDCWQEGNMTPGVVSYNCIAGQTYYIMVDSYGGNVCNFNVVLTGPVCITACTPPVMTNGTTATVCSGTALNFGLTANIAGTTFSWVATDNPNVSGESLTAQSGATINNTLVNNTTSAQTVTYTVTPTAAGCVGAPQTVTITVNPLNSITAGSNRTVCINTAITNITMTTTGATGATFTGLPAGVTGTWSGNTVTISGTPTAAGTYNYTVTTTGGCPPATATGTITVTANNTVTPASSNPTICINTAITPNITFTTTGATGIGAASGLPSGVSASFSVITITVSGTPTAAGTYPYTIPLTGGCGTVNATGTITVTANNTVTPASSNPTICINTAITPNIIITTTGATGIGAASGLPSGVSASFSGNTITVSGTPTVTGTFPYTIPLTGGCGTVNAIGTITVTANNTVSPPSTNPTICINTAISPNITFTTTGATGIGAASGLPSGVSANFSGNTITVSGTPTASGTFPYSIPLTGGCGTVNATGTITVTVNNTVTPPSTNPTLCINTAISPNITFTTTGATGIGPAAGLPAGVSASFSGNTITVSGTPTASGTFPYTIPMTGGCGTVNATGTITVSAINTVTPPSSNPSVCINTALSPSVTFTTTGATGIGAASGLPSGVSATWFGNTITISGTPTVAGTFPYTIPLTGGCGSVNATGTITVNSIPTISLTPNPPSVCNGTNGSIQVIGSGTGTVAWSGTASGSSAATLSFSITGLSAGNYNVTYTDGITGCISTVVSTTIINPGAPVIDPMMNLSTCGTPIQILESSVTGTNLTGNLGFYSSPGGVGLIADGTTFNSPTPATTIFVYDFNGVCSAEISFTVTVNPIPTVNLPANVLVCPGAAINSDDFVSVPAGATYAWANTNIAVGLPVSGSGQITTYNAPANGTGAIVSGDITVTPTLNGCAGLSQTFNISISPTPTVNDPIDITVCPGATIDPADFVSVPAGATFNWTNSNASNGLAVSGSGQISSYTAPVNATGSPISGDVTVTPMLNGCVGSPQIFVITVSPSPTITLTPTPPSACNGTNGSILVNGAGSGTVTWSGTASGTNPSANLNFAITGLSAGNYDVFFIDGSTGCQTPTVSTTLINPGAPVVDPITSVLNCGTSYSLPVISGTNLTAPQYYTLPGGPSGGGGVVASGTTYMAPTNVTLYAFDANGACTDEESFTITINSLPTAAVSGGGVYCNGNPIGNVEVTVTGAPSWTVTYTLNGGASQTASGNSSPISLGNIPGTYAISGISDANCTNAASGTQTITVNPLPSVTGVSGGATYCPGAIPADILVAVSGTGPWTINYTLNGNPMTTSGSVSPISLGNAFGTYVVTGVSDALCSATASGGQSIVLNTIPVITLTPTDPSICNATDGNILVSGSGSGTVVWNGAASGTNAAATLNYSITSFGAGNYDVYFIDGTTGCQSATVSTDLNNPGAPVLDDVLDQLVCDTYTLPTITGTNLSGSASYWSGPGATGIQFFPGDALTSTQTIYAYDVIGSCTDEQSGLIIVNQTPVITNPGNQTACVGYTLPVIAGLNITGLAAYYSSSGANGNYYIPGDVITTDMVIYIYDQASSCIDEESFSIQINPLPTVTAVSGGASYCPGDLISPIDVDVTGSPSWTIDYTLDGVAQTATGASSPIVLGNAPGVYVLTNIADANCSNNASGTQTITINPYPPSPLVGNDSSYCSSWTLTELVVTGTGGLYTWYADPLLTPPALGIGPTLIPQDILGSTSYYVTETLNGCQGPASVVTITIEDCEIIVPTAFTPDGDGVNEDWQIVDLDEVYPGNVVTIYNRWGNVLYKHDSTVDGPYDQDRWDGKFNGEALPVGSYYFIIDLGVEGEESRSGTVSILTK
jgi:gliding motility-associated-like protein